jgi:hypothetical protein
MAKLMIAGIAMDKLFICEFCRFLIPTSEIPLAAAGLAVEFSEVKNTGCSLGLCLQTTELLAQEKSKRLAWLSAKETPAEERDTAHRR